MKNETITRYTISHINSHGMHTITLANQGRHFDDTLEQAQNKLANLFYANNLDSLEQIWGPFAIGSLMVSPIECYPNGDACWVYFGSHLPVQYQGSNKWFVCNVGGNESDEIEFDKTPYDSLALCVEACRVLNGEYD